MSFVSRRYLYGWSIVQLQFELHTEEDWYVYFYLNNLPYPLMCFLQWARFIHCVIPLKSTVTSGRNLTEYNRHKPFNFHLSLFCSDDPDMMFHIISLSFFCVTLFLFSPPTLEFSNKAPLLSSGFFKKHCLSPCLHRSYADFILKTVICCTFWIRIQPGIILDSNSMDISEVWSFGTLPDSLLYRRLTIVQTNFRVVF